MFPFLRSLVLSSTPLRLFSFVGLVTNSNTEYTWKGSGLWIDVRYILYIIKVKGCSHPVNTALAVIRRKKEDNYVSCFRVLEGATLFERNSLPKLIRLAKFCSSYSYLLKCHHLLEASPDLPGWIRCPLHLPMDAFRLFQTLIFSNV